MLEHSLRDSLLCLLLELDEFPVLGYIEATAVSTSKAFHLLFYSEQNGQSAVVAFSVGNTVSHLSYDVYFFLLTHREDGALLGALCSLRAEHSAGMTCGRRHCFQPRWLL